MARCLLAPGFDLVLCCHFRQLVLVEHDHAEFLRFLSLSNTQRSSGDEDSGTLWDLVKRAATEKRLPLPVARFSCLRVVLLSIKRCSTRCPRGYGRSTLAGSGSEATL